MGRRGNRQDKKKEKHGPPREPRNLAIVSKLRALDSSRAKSAASEKHGDSEHRLNEALLVKWTRRLAVFTIVLAIAGVLPDGISIVTLGVTGNAASQQAADTQKALSIAGSQADAAANQASEVGVQIETAKQTAASQEADTRAALKIAGDQAAAGGAQASAAGVQADSAKLTAQTAQEEMIANSRAWVGPTNALLKAAPSLGQELELTIQYQNTGREPARDVMINVQQDIRPDGSFIAAQIGTFAKACLATGIGNNVVYPATGFGGGYEFHMSIAGPRITQAVIDGTDWVFAYGCFVYSTLGEVHRSSFCYFFQNGPTATIGNLSICGVGQHAD